MKLPKSVKKALQMAAQAHKGQMYGDKPYMSHLMDVFSLAVQCGFRGEEILSACILHDTLEDTHITFEEIEDYIGLEVAEIVQAVTDEQGENRKERKAKTYPKTAANYKAVVVKLFDRIANIQNAFVHEKHPQMKMYLKEDKLFRQSLQKEHHPKAIRPLWVKYSHAIECIKFDLELNDM